MRSRGRLSTRLAERRGRSTPGAVTPTTPTPPVAPTPTPPSIVDQWQALPTAQPGMPPVTLLSLLNQWGVFGPPQPPQRPGPVSLIGLQDYQATSTAMPKLPPPPIHERPGPTPIRTPGVRRGGLHAR